MAVKLYEKDPSKLTILEDGLNPLFIHQRGRREDASGLTPSDLRPAEQRSTESNEPGIDYRP